VWYNSASQKRKSKDMKQKIEYTTKDGERKTLITDSEPVTDTTTHRTYAVYDLEESELPSGFRTLIKRNIGRCEYVSK
jgi:hypothetical protein